MKSTEAKATTIRNSYGLVAAMNKYFVLLCLLSTCSNSPVSTNRYIYDPVVEYSEGNYVSNAFFWVDSVYLKQFNKRAAHSVDTIAHLPTIQTIQVWLQANPPDFLERPTAVYRNISAFDSPSTMVSFGEEGIVFRQLVQNVDYYVDLQQGYIRIDRVDARPDNRCLAIFLTTDDPTIVPNKGDTTTIGTSTSGNLPILNRLWLLKDIELEKSQPTFFLMWRNVYSLPKDVNTEKVRVSVTTIDTFTTSRLYINGRLIMEILGLSNSDGKPFLANTSIYDFVNGYLIIPAFADSAIGNQPFRNPFLGNLVNPKPYVLSRTEYNSDSSPDKEKFKISICMMK